MFQQHTLESAALDMPKFKIAICLGANLGDRYANVERALHEMDSRSDVLEVASTSFLYESAPMYVEDQPKYLNCVITAETTLSPPDLLRTLKEIETLVGRIAGPRYGPRAIDLDILFYGSTVFDTRSDGGDGSKPGELVIPHPRLAEREFVLRPLNDLLPDYVHPVLNRTVGSLLAAISEPSSLRRVLPIPPPQSHPDIPTLLLPVAPAPRTYIMGILNATPDSFASPPADTAAAIAAGLAAAAAGADILDVGGYSTRPGAAPVSQAEELARVVPVIRGLRAAGVFLPISIDTFRPAILREAVGVGANCLNDVTALAGGPADEDRQEDMAATAHALRVPVILMHSRGAHKVSEDKDYGERGVLAGVRAELGNGVQRALRAGIRRWSIVVDPGYGFSKTMGGNLELLRRLRALSAQDDGGNPLKGFPTLVGLSRKSFLGALLGRETKPVEREWASCAAFAAAVQQGADIVRVHDVAAMRDVVKVADAVWR